MKMKTMILFLCAAPMLFGQGFYSLDESKPWHAGFVAGIGIPKLQTSNFRTPVSFFAGVNSNVNVVHRFGLRAGVNALYTVNLGTSTDKGGKLRFNVVYGNLDIVYKLRTTRISSSSLAAGWGRYWVHQQLHQLKNDWETDGFSMALIFWKQTRKFKTQFELRWHLLFEPNTDIQILTLGYGLVL